MELDVLLSREGILTRTVSITSIQAYCIQGCLRAMMLDKSEDRHLTEEEQTEGLRFHTRIHLEIYPTLSLKSE
eukprot:1787694-Rhodomonas_salina.4